MLIAMIGCTRPGWQEFFSEMSQKYEMHVYTMGTRAYAEEVCAAIDPGGRIFGGRILSRDESGSKLCIDHSCSFTLTHSHTAHCFKA